MKKITTSMSLFDCVLDKFRELYPVNLSSFVERVLSACIADRELFERLYFGAMLPEVQK